MSVAELVILIRKPAGVACGFTLIKNSCTINRIMDSTVAEDVRPGDLIMSINDQEVDDTTVREVLRNCRDLTEIILTIARTSFQDRRFADQSRALDIHSPVNNNKACFCFSIFQRTSKENAPPNLPTVEDPSPKMLGSVTSLGSASVRPVDLRKLHKEGAGTMWMVGRSNSAR